jgi:hypothetical protein
MSSLRRLLSFPASSSSNKDYRASAEDGPAGRGAHSHFAAGGTVSADLDAVRGGAGSAAVAAASLQAGDDTGTGEERVAASVPESGVQRKHTLWSQAGQKVLRELPLKPWAARRREDLLGLLSMLDQQIEPVDRAVKEEAQRDKMALLLQTPWGGSGDGAGLRADHGRIAVRFDPGLRKEYLHCCHQKPKAVAALRSCTRLRAARAWMSCIRVTGTAGRFCCPQGPARSYWIAPIACSRPTTDSKRRFRVALGARRKRLVRKALVESVTLSVIGGTVGIRVAYAGTRLIILIVRC